MNQHRVVITGSAGRLGGIAFAALAEAGHDVVGTDCIVPRETQRHFVQINLGDAEVSDLQSLFDKADCVIHLAALADDSDDYDFEKDLLHVNVGGTWKVLEAARRAGVPRVCLASSLQVVDGYLQKGLQHISAELPTRPRYLYAVTKVSLEALGQVYASKHGLEVLAVRFGWCPRSHRHIAALQHDPLAQDLYLSPGDGRRFFQAVVNAKQWSDRPPNGRERGGFSVVNATSNPTNILDRLDQSGCRAIGFLAEDRWPTGVTEGLPLEDER